MRYKVLVTFVPQPYFREIDTRFFLSSSPVLLCAYMKGHSSWPKSKSQIGSSLREPLEFLGNSQS